ncbi:phosphodiesterase [bacterium]|nr:MAG: phosphodiesterase [bacterium]
MDDDNLYRELFERSPHPAWVYDAQTLRFLAVNQAALEHYGYSRDEFFAMTLADIRPTEDAALLLDECLTDPPPATFDGFWRHRRRDGSIIDVEIVTSNVSWHGRPAVAVSVSDVTDRSAAQRRQHAGHVGSWHVDVRSARVERSEGMYRLYGVERPAEEPGIGILLHRTHPDDLLALSDALERALGDGTAFVLDHRIVLPGGAVRWLQTRAEASLGNDGRPTELNGTSVDITERKEAENAAEEALVRLKMLYEQLPTIVWSTDRELRVTFVVGKALAAAGLTEEALLGRTVAEIAAQLSDSAMTPAHANALVGRSEAFETVWGSLTFQVYVEPLRDRSGVIVGVAGVAHDVTEEREAKQHLEYFAYHDALTGLPNRLALERILQRLLAELDTSIGQLAVIFADLDGFAAFNDALGHARGDELLVAVAERLRSRMMGNDFLCRWSGDEFVIVHQGRREREEIGKRVEYILEAFGEDFVLYGQHYKIDASAGVALAPANGMDQVSLLRAADAAMSRAKKRARGAIAFFDEELQVAAERRFSNENQLRVGLADNEFSVVYQPMRSARTLRIVGVEALIRWNSAVLGRVEPTEFVPVAEEVGLIDPIGAWVMHEACRQGREWKDQGLGPVRMGVNISSHQVRYSNFAHRVYMALEETGLDPRLLELELTERIMLDAEPAVLKTLSALRLLGTRLSIDDFGTGFSSLQYLKSMRVDTLKIDRQFVKDMPEDRFGVAIARSIISLGHSLGLQVTAEGVETEAQRDLLRSMECDELQGYLLGMPLAAGECTRLLAAERDRYAGEADAGAVDADHFVKSD